MVSGVSFRNPNSDNVKRKKTKIASIGLIFAFIVLVSVVSVYGVAFFLKKQAQTKLNKVVLEINDKEAKIKKGLEENSQKASSLLAVENNLYKQQGLDKILNEFGNGMVPRVVLSSLSYSENKNGKDGKKEIELIVTGDAETDDVLAAQIRSWKGNHTFSKVSVSDISVDEETGRKVFLANLVLNDVSPDKRPFGI